jgi:hypothetical protein
MTPNAADKADLDAVTGALYGAFDNRGGRSPDLDRLHRILLPDCVISRVVGTAAEVQGVNAFFEKRRPLLTEGRLVDFAEWETDARTWACGNVAGTRSQPSDIQ